MNAEKVKLNHVSARDGYDMTEHLRRVKEADWNSMPLSKRVAETVRKRSGFVTTRCVAEEALTAERFRGSLSSMSGRQRHSQEDYKIQQGGVVPLPQPHASHLLFAPLLSIETPSGSRFLNPDTG